MPRNVAAEESTKTYGGIVTDKGNELMMDAIANGRKVRITQFAVGDGGGAYYRPETSQTALKNEQWRGPINSCEIEEGRENVLLVTAVCPSTAGGFTIRELAVFDEGGHMVAICNSPETPKVKISDGAATEMRLTLRLALINGEAVELVVDPNIVTATKKDVEELWRELSGMGRVTIGTADAGYEENEIRLIVDRLPY